MTVNTADTGMSRVLIGGELRCHRHMTDFSTKSIRLHIMVAAVSKNSDDKKVDAGQKHSEEYQFTNPIVARLIGQFVTQVIQSKKPNLFLSLSKKQTDEDHQQATHKTRAENHIDKST